MVQWSNRWNVLTSRSSNTKCGKYRPTDDALKYSFIFKNRNKHKEQREERGTIQRTDATRINQSYADLSNDSYEFPEGIDKNNKRDYSEWFSGQTDGTY